MRIPLPDSEKANAPYDPIVHRTTWIYRAILGVLFVMCVSLMVQAHRMNHSVHDLQQQITDSRNSRMVFQDNQRALSCLILKQTHGVDPVLCNADGTAVDTPNGQ